jgi:hypothetical protein
MRFSFALGLVITLLMSFWSSALGGTGIPDPANCSVSASGSGVCAPGAVVCPSGDQDIVTVEVIVRDSYYEPLSDMVVDVYRDPAIFGFCFCPGEETKQGVTDLNGMMTVEFSEFGGCGDMKWFAEWTGVELGSSPEIFILTYDTNADCQVDLSDFINFAIYYQTMAVCPDYDCDGLVALSDFISFAGHYLHVCP